MVKKRGQVTLFILAGIVILMSALLMFYLKSSNAGATSQTSVEKISKAGFETAPIKNYIERCLKNSAEKSFLDRIGLQGGYVSTSGHELSKYYDRGAGDFYSGTGDMLVIYDSHKVPFYMDGDAESIIPKEQIEKKSARYIFAEFLDCINFSEFSKFGYIINAPDTENILPDLKNDFASSIYSVKVGINDKDISVKLAYPITIKKEAFKADIPNFIVTIPFGLGESYDTSRKIIDKIKQRGQISNQYNISLDCNIYNLNGMTNIYYKPMGKDSGVIQIVDFSTYYNYYFKSFVFQFAVKNVNVTGQCAGSRNDLPPPLPESHNEAPPSLPDFR